MVTILKALKSIWDVVKFILSLLLGIWFYEKFIRPKQEPQTITNNDNSTSVNVGKIKKTSGINELTSVSTKKDASELKEIVENRIEEINKKPIIKNKDKRVKKSISKKVAKLEQATVDGKIKKAKRLTKKIEKKVKKS